MASPAFDLSQALNQALSYLPDWRWLLDRESSPWYPSARLFRQDDTRRWDSVIARVRTALMEFIANAR
ncbi:MAG TPA: hypothetical protein VIV34_11645 [Pseudolabrys sp.]